MEELIGYYMDTFDRRNCAPTVRRTMLDALEAGMEPGVICAAMDAAAACERPSWAYAAAVIARCVQEGALTLPAYEARSAAHRGSSVGFGRRRREGTGFNDYLQRDYSGESLEELFTKLD